MVTVQGFTSQREDAIVSRQDGVKGGWAVVVRALALALSVTLVSGGTAHAQEMDVQRVDLPTGRSFPITFPASVSKISVANPEVADAVAIADREVVVSGSTGGETDVIVWLSTGQRFHYRFVVRSPADRLQIVLSLKFAEVRRDALHQFGVSGLYRDDNIRVGTGVLRSDNAIDELTGKFIVPGEGSFVSVLTDFGTDKLLAFIELEAQKGNARILAEPRLLAGNKEEATFLAGGELPIPIAQAGASDLTGVRVTIMWREFGVRLRFVGEIISDSLIKLAVRPEVSTLDYGNAILISGFRVPALRTRRVETTMDVRRDQSLVISGLFNDERERVRTGIPFLMDVPIIGNLFASTRWQQSQSELLVVVTPTIVDPMRPRPQDVLQLKPDTALPAADVIKERLRTPAQQPVRVVRPQ